MDNTLTRFRWANLHRFVFDLCRTGHEGLRDLGLTPPSFRRYVCQIGLLVVRAFFRSKTTRREVQIVDELLRLHTRMGIQLTREQAVGLILRCEPLIRGRLSVDREAFNTIATLNLAGIKLGLVSNTLAPSFLLDDYLASISILPFLPVRVYSSDARFMKPSREIFQIALDRLGSRPERTVFVGNCPRRDVIGAARAGMRTILIDPKGTTPRRGSRPDHVVRRLSEIPPLVLPSTTHEENRPLA